MSNTILFSNQLKIKKYCQYFRLFVYISINFNYHLINEMKQLLKILIIEIRSLNYE